MSPLARYIVDAIVLEGQSPTDLAPQEQKSPTLGRRPDVRIVSDDGQLLRALTLDPTRGYQPLGGRWPVHNVLQQVSTMS